jgi:hypothetical protein
MQLKTKRVMKRIKYLLLFSLILMGSTSSDFIDKEGYSVKELSPGAMELLKGKQILFVEREQYARDHHNTETLFQKGEINAEKFAPGSALRIYNVSEGTIKTLVESKTGVVRDPELSFDAQKVIFSMRKSKDDSYSLYEINIDGTGLKQLTFARGVSDIDPLYLPDGGIVFSSTRQPKYCMCNRHIMANLYRMNADGSNISQIGVSTLFEGHASLMNDGRILYDRWEYVDRNFGDAQGLWTVNPDGARHSVYYGNNTKSPDGVIDGRQMGNSDLVAAIFTACHERPWGSLAIIDRKKGVDGIDPVVRIWPANSIEHVKSGGLDAFIYIDNYYEDPFPVNGNNLLVSRTVSFKRDKGLVTDSKMGIYLIGTDDDTEELLIEGNKSLFDPMIVSPRMRPPAIPFSRNFSDTTGVFYVQNVYEGTHVEGINKGDVKYLRVIETPEKRTWTKRGWGGQGEQAPAVNWHSFETKRILGDVVVEADGSAHFEVPAKTFVYFQLLDKDKKMVHSMRSGTMVMPGEINGCIGCHEDRLSVPPPGPSPYALRKGPQKLKPLIGNAPVNFSFMEHVQPVFDKHCITCHDFDKNNRNKLVLARDKNPFFNAAYINLYTGKYVTLVGGGPAEIQTPYSWGSHASKLTKVIDGDHHDVKLSQHEREILYAWMDVNGVYYPVYESAFDSTLAGRSPLTDNEINELGKLTGINFGSLNNHKRPLSAQISFDRPEESPCLDTIREDKVSYDRAVAILKMGQLRLAATPRGDIERELVPCNQHREQLKKYMEQLEIEKANNVAIQQNRKFYDVR